MKKIIGTAIFLLPFLTSCEKEIDLDLENKSGQLVIEGNISDQVEPHLVRITRSVAFTEPNKYPAVSNAFVSISDNTGFVDTLKYVSNGQYITNKLKAGVSGKTYTLKVVFEGKTYEAKSTLPQSVPLTGLKLNSMTFFGSTNYDVLPEYIDPIFLGNLYYFKVEVSSQKVTSVETFTDNFGNGTANQRSLNLPNDTENSIKNGDSVKVEMRCIDKNIYTYFSAINQISGGGPGGGVSPANPPSNISNGALGYFSAHTSVEKSLIVK